MILEALFNGEIYASENVVPKSDMFRQNAEEITGILNTLQEKLPPEHFALLERLCDRYADEGTPHLCQLEKAMEQGGVFDVLTAIT